jgi:ribonuclease HI
MILNRDDDSLIKSYYGKIINEKMTNNMAEYIGIIKGLEAVKEYDPEVLTVISDSQVCIRQLQGKYQCRAPNLIPLYNDTKELSKLVGCDITFIWEPRDTIYLKECDIMCNKALGKIHES